MRDKVAFFASDENDKKILTAIHFDADKKVLHIRSVSENLLTDELTDLILHRWIDGTSIEFPEGHNYIEWSLSEKSFLPDEIKPDRPEKIRIIQNEWTLKLLSIQLYELICEEIIDINKKVDSDEKYSQDHWNAATAVWDKALEHIKEDNLTREHRKDIKIKVNIVFEKLKELKKEANKELIGISAKNLEKFSAQIKAIEDKVSPKHKLNDLFNQLRKIQEVIFKSEFVSKDRNKIRKHLDVVFTRIKSERSNLNKNRLQNRLSGLTAAIDRMESSLKRDRDSFEYQNNKINSPRATQLEQQLRATKVKVLEERIRGKEEKLLDMQQTLEKLQKQENKKTESKSDS